MNCDQEFTYGDCLRHVANAWNPEAAEKAKRFRTHLTECPDCQRVINTMNHWVEEDRKIVERIMGLPFRMLEGELYMAINQGNAASASPIVERLIQEDKQGNRHALSLLRMAAEQAPGVAGARAREYIQTPK